MGLTLETVVFYFLAVFIIAMSILTVTTQRIVRSATYLLFVLFGTAGIYFLLGYTFPRIGTDHGLCRRYRGALCILHPADEWRRRPGRSPETE